MIDHEADRAWLRRVAARVGAPVDAAEPPERRTVGGGDPALNVVDWCAPRPGAPTVLLVHGGRLTARTWDGVCLLLRDTYRCLALDLRGHGDSGWSADRQYRLDDYRDDLARAVDALRLDDFALVGMSLGGIVAVAYAVERPSALGSLTIVDIGPNSAEDGAEVGSRIRAFAGRTSGSRPFEDFVREALVFSPERDEDGLRASLRHALRALPDGRCEWKWDPAQYARARWGRDGVFSRVAEIAVPALVVRGGNSRVLSPQGASRLVASLARGRLVTIEGAGHTVQSDKPRELAAALREFLGSS